MDTHQQQQPHKQPQTGTTTATLTQQHHHHPRRQQSQQHTTKLPVNPTASRPNVTHYTTSSDGDLIDTGDEMQLAQPHTSRITGKHQGLSTYHPTVVTTQDRSKVASRDTRKTVGKPARTESLWDQSKQLSSFPDPQYPRRRPQHPRRRPQPTSSQPLISTAEHTQGSSNISRDTTKQIRETFPHSSSITPSINRSLLDKPGRVEKEQKSIPETTSDSESIDLATAVRTARRQSITSSFARIETRASNPPKQRLPLIDQKATPSMRQDGKTAPSGPDPTRTALEKQYSSLMSSFTEKQRLTRQALVLGSQSRMDRFYTDDSRPTTSRRKERGDDGVEDGKSTPLVDPQVDVSGSASSDTASESNDFSQSDDGQTTSSRLSQTDLTQSISNRTAKLPPKQPVPKQDTAVRNFTVQKGTNKEQQYVRAYNNKAGQLDQCRTDHADGKVHDDKTSGTARVSTKNHARLSMNMVKESSLRGAKESSQSDIPIPPSSWSTRRRHIYHRKIRTKLDPGSTSDISSDSEYRGPDNRSITQQHSPTTLGPLTAAQPIQRGRRRKSIWTKPIMWVLRMFLWLAFLVTVQIMVMGLLFRPISKNVEKGSPQIARTISYKERDYGIGQPGFMTFLEDGFGTETLAFCHDLLELSNGQHRQLRAAQPLQDRLFGSLIHAYDAALGTASSISSGAGRWLGSKWASLWEEEEQDDPLDWLAN